MCLESKTMANAFKLPRETDYREGKLGEEENTILKRVQREPASRSRWSASELGKKTSRGKITPPEWTRYTGPR